MILSTRNMPPRHLNIVQAKAQNNATFRKLLLSSPLPSPSLPSIVPRHGKKPRPLNTKSVLRGLYWLTGLVTVVWLVTGLSRREYVLAGAEFRSSNGQTYEIVGEDDLPEYPSPVVVTDTHGQSKWTISIPHSLDFPLSSSDYSDICSQSDDVARHVKALTGRESHNNYDPNYIDVSQAQKKGLLPPPQDPHKSHKNVCKRTLTFLLNDSSAGFGTHLLSLWLAFALAKREGRAFFLDDHYFAYGEYAKFFTPPTQANCIPPPKEERVPCPSQARHLIVDAKTLGFIMSGRFGEKEVFGMAREGYNALYSLSNAEDSDFVGRRTTNLLRDGANHVGVHIRHGDRHPLQFQYEESYIPTRIYMSAAKEVLSRHPGVSLVVSSDDPDVFSDPELVVEGAVVERAQDRMSLASKNTMESGSLGWEGGFFKDVFWGLGLPEQARREIGEKLGSPTPTRKKKKQSEKAKFEAGVTNFEEEGARDYRKDPTDEALQLRQLIGRAYLLDLEILSRSSVVICGGGTNTCQILAVMMGWDAIQSGRWINIDAGVEGWNWRGH